MSPLPIISPQLLSAYGIPPQMDIGTQGVQAPKLPAMDGVTGGTGITGATGIQPVDGDSFGSMLGKMVQEVNAKQVDAGNAVASLQAGGNVSLHQTVIAMEEANVSFQLMTEVRNKLLEAYQEIMRMSV